MTIRSAYEYALIECNKLNAPALLLEDYIYLFNKAIQQYVNSVYNRAEYNQQSSDDLGWLHTITELSNSSGILGLDDTIHLFKMPKDYLHLLNCKVMLSGVNKISNKCDTDARWSSVVNCSRLTANLEGGINNNYYNKPSIKKPYYYIVNRNWTTRDDDKFINSNGLNGKQLGSRITNQSDLFIEIHLGKCDCIIDKVQLTYLRSPMYVNMTQEELYDEADNTQVLEFPDYVCYEIINIFTRLLMENSGDPRLSTVIPINQTIGGSN